MREQYDWVWDDAIVKAIREQHRDVLSGDRWLRERPCGRAVRGAWGDDACRDLWSPVSLKERFHWLYGHDTGAWFTMGQKGLEPYS